MSPEREGEPAMSDMPFRSFFGGDPFRGFEELTGRVFGGMEGWPGLLQMLDDGRLTDGRAARSTSPTPSSS
jgi:ATP-dependent Clp protease ATP-binding subunit ClpC